MSDGVLQHQCIKSVTHGAKKAKDYTLSSSRLFTRMCRPGSLRSPAEMFICQRASFRAGARTPRRLFRVRDERSKRASSSEDPAIFLLTSIEFVPTRAQKSLSDDRPNVLHVPVESGWIFTRLPEGAEVRPRCGRDARVAVGRSNGGDAVQRADSAMITKVEKKCSKQLEALQNHSCQGV